ncbi:MAG: MarR family transcriptional regulator [Dehalococcoidales bacterium]|jgi:DNA-binding MarR family transcriptional regulator
MLDRRSQIEGILQSFHAIRHRLLTGTYILSAKNQIPNSQWMVLRIVYQNEGIGVKELSRMLGISSSAATQLVNSLVKKGHLVREVNLEDRRALKIRPSKKTKELIDISNTQALGKVYSLFDVLSDEELQKYCDLSKKVAVKILEK